ncbi:DUF7275 domain-containing protein [Saccharopolyspora pogona]|uniref:DUF7275 domain-containing protein n=1 Tax=Saccharopolyspora pogona TaxID=333966 RepID=UPI0016898AD9|nr:hypothetical protein [Saccharopolyspora pogona]
MTYLVIGSTAMRAYIPECREPKDLDVFTQLPLDGAETFWHPSFEEWITPGTARYATLDELYTLKVSHSYWELKNGSWDKHINDGMALKAAGARLLLDLHKLLYKVWEEKHGKKKVDLSQEAEDFFSDAVKRIYEHDSIHDSVAYGDRPLYESVLKDGASVDIDMGKIRGLPFEDKVRLYREEIYATALERLVIPSGYKCSPRRAYSWALRRTITSLTKGWSARFLVENYDVFRSPDCDYVARHKEKKHKLFPLEV